MARDTDNCTSVSLECPVEETIYGYYPSLGANAFFCAYFAVFLFLNLILTWRYKTWFYGTLITLGAAGEMAGYIGRIMMHSNPWSNSGFELQICTLIFSPSFLAAGLYLTLKHMVRAIGPQFSSIKPIAYPWIFMLCDLFSLVLQAIGGGVASSSNNDKTTSAGGNIMLAGIVFQVATFTFLYGLTVRFILNLRRNRDTMTPEASGILHGKNFKIFALGMLFASVFIYIRCVYRIAELAEGWANSIMRDQTGYIVLDGVMCSLAIIPLTFCHPGIFFKPMLSSSKAATAEKQRPDSDGSVMA